MSLGAGEILVCGVGISALSKRFKRTHSAGGEIGASIKNSARSKKRYLFYL